MLNMDFMLLWTWHTFWGAWWTWQLPLHNCCLSQGHNYKPMTHHWLWRWSWGHLLMEFSFQCRQPHTVIFCCCLTVSVQILQLCVSCPNCLTKMHCMDLDNIPMIPQRSWTVCLWPAIIASHTFTFLVKIFGMNTHHCCRLSSILSVQLKRFTMTHSIVAKYFHKYTMGFCSSIFKF